MAKQIIYTIGGTVQAGGGIYIKRKADDELIELCRKGEFAFILSSRQVGKSSLIMRTAMQLEMEKIHSTAIDLSAIGVKISQDEWYLGILNEISNAFNLRTDIFEWWRQRASLGNAQRLINFFSDVLLKEINGQIVLFFDEIDSTLSIDFSDDFYVALRAVYNARSNIPDFKRLSFVLVGVATPSDLIADNRRTPFNIGRRVELDDFTLDEALPLATGLGGSARLILRWIFNFTGGHPYLTQRLCAHIAKINDTITQESVAKEVSQLFIGEQGKLDNNLQFVRDMLTKRSPNIRSVLLTYRNVRLGKKVFDDEHSITKAHLKLSGLVRSEKGLLQVRNKIYYSVFTPQWVKEKTPKNWTKISAIGFAIMTFALLGIFIYNFYISSLGSKYYMNFYKSQTSSERLKYLVGLFELKGVLQDTNYDLQARELFFNLNWKDQISLFNDPNISMADRQKYLPIVVEGLYVAMANMEGGQDNTELLQTMSDSLKGVNSPDSNNLQKEINIWIEARKAETSEGSLEKYNDAIDLNETNPATHYERAIIEIKLDIYEQALLDLNETMGLAQNLSSSSPIPGPTLTPRPTKTPVPQTNTSVGSNTAAVTPIVEIKTITAPLTTLDEASETPLTFTPTLTPIVSIPIVTPYNRDEGYKSSFYSFLDIRSAIALVLQENEENLQFINSLYKLSQSNPSKISFLEDAGLVTETSLQSLNCMLDSNANIYIVTPNSSIVDIFQHAATPTPRFTPLPLTPSPTPDFILPTVMAMEQERRTLETKQAAFDRLVYEVERWTYIQKIELDKTSQAYIMVTFISPELVQTVFLNNMLARNEATTNIQTEIENALLQFSRREEMIFMVTIMVNSDSSPLSSHKLEIDINKMMLVNSFEMSIPPQHGDQNLDEPIDLSTSPVFGYLYYPMSVMVNATCTQVLDPIYNTKIVIQTEGIKVDSAFTPLIWTIPYKPLIETGTSFVPVYENPEPTFLANMQPLRAPPVGSDAVDWEEFAKFIWGQIILEIY